MLGTHREPFSDTAAPKSVIKTPGEAEHLGKRFRDFSLHPSIVYLSVSHLDYTAALELLKMCVLILELE